MHRKIGFGLLWLGFLVYAFLFAPPDDPKTLALITHLSTGQWDSINPLVIALFNIMGVLPFIYCAVLFVDGQGQKIWAFPFAIGSFFLGAFALLPYLALRQPNPTVSGELNLSLKVLDSRWLGIVLSAIALVLVGWGFSQGNWSDFVQQWQSSRFIHVMSLDFCLLSSVFPAVLGDDMARRGLVNSTVFWVVALIPLFGPLAYLCIRPPLVAGSASAQT
ncbi:MAG: DUF2834 domain-containing protein [Spirulina sp. SIO3F2]|nr:DUF2834 domain-containing protein [Spirulina sp. SIO3F2]